MEWLVEENEPAIERVVSALPIAGFAFPPETLTGLNPPYFEKTWRLAFLSLLKARTLELAGEHDEALRLQVATLMMSTRSNWGALSRGHDFKLAPFPMISAMQVLDVLDRVNLGQVGEPTLKELLSVMRAEPEADFFLILAARRDAFVARVRALPTVDLSEPPPLSLLREPVLTLFERSWNARILAMGETRSFTLTDPPGVLAFCHPIKWTANYLVNTASYLPRFHENYAYYLARVRGFEIRLARELYRRKNGGPPESLEQLTPELLDNVPDNPMSPGRPFVIRDGGLYGFWEGAETSAPTTWAQYHATAVGGRRGDEMTEPASKGLGCFATGAPLVCLLVLMDMQKDREGWAGLFFVLILMGLCCRYVLSRLSAPLVLLALLGLPSWSFLEDVDKASPLITLWFLLTLPCLVGAFFAALPYLAVRGDRLIAQVLPIDKVPLSLARLLKGPTMLLGWCTLSVMLVRAVLPNVTIGYVPLGPAYFEGLSWGFIALPALMLIEFALVEGLRREKVWAAALLGPAAALLDFATGHQAVAEVLGLLWLACLLAGLSLLARQSLRTAWVVSNFGVMVASMWLAPRSAASLSVVFVLVFTLLLGAMAAQSQSAPGPVKALAAASATLRALSPFHWLLDVGSKIRWLDGEGPVFD